MRDIKQHESTIKTFLDLIFSQYGNHFILKGGTALRYCYGLNRFSEDIDLDSIDTEIAIEKTLQDYCAENKYSFRFRKNSNTVKRCIIHYNNLDSGDDLLKIEISFRRGFITKEAYTYINGVYVYTLDELCALKLAAYSDRAKIRDLYDLCFLGNCCFDSLSNATKRNMQNVMAERGLDFADSLLVQSEDNLIDKDALAVSVLDLYGKLNLIDDVPSPVDDWIP